MYYSIYKSKKKITFWHRNNCKLHNKIIKRQNTLFQQFMHRRTPRTQRIIIKFTIYICKITKHDRFDWPDFPIIIFAVVLSVYSHIYHAVTYISLYRQNALLYYSRRVIFVVIFAHFARIYALAPPILTYTPNSTIM